MSKPIKIMLTSLVTLTLVGVIVIVALLYLDSSTSEASEPSIDDQVENSFVTEEITTDLLDGSFVKIKFRIVTDSQQALSYLQKGEGFQLNNSIIKVLTVKESADFRTGLEQIEESIKLKLNELLDEGLVTEVYVIEKVLQ
ncbi:flagellar basal body-associated FliL family protein [Piscibacillus halophilus]|uniref:Flagellar protein FliL n=1 Tax=Piscibacillus halophilus TaxID=571933 RepID=A0A1H8YYL7_9BACI|nr:flagellar basal body-associated FliL family protein [Piscibacillus halophilus]SEP57300.1 flagellar FliL protein [Piscibacillus halophilus]